MTKLRILLVEDDLDIRESMALILEAEEYEVSTAQDGKDALEQINATTLLPDLIITDLMMPIMTGFELIDIIKKLDRLKLIPIIVHSAVSCYNTSNHLLDGCSLLSKPCNLDTLLALVKEAVLKQPTVEAVVSI